MKRWYTLKTSNLHTFQAFICVPEKKFCRSRLEATLSLVADNQLCFFAFIKQLILYIQTAEAVRLNRFGPPRHGKPDFDSPDYRRARSCFRSNRAHDSNSMALGPPRQNNDDIILIGGPPRHQVLDLQAFFANARLQQPPHRPQHPPNQVQIRMHWTLQKKSKPRLKTSTVFFLKMLIQMELCQPKFVIL